MQAQPRPARQLWFSAAGLVMGLAAIGLAVAMLTTWEVDLFKATTQDMDFTGLVCGTPLDHPDWARGEPCDGAVNRQLAASGLILLSGITLVAASTVLFAWERGRRANPAGF